mmetsp:Transcript_50833/g.111289  ORF Transcript_50833/g.111289 Transcript_50833/m.111289 type:complete len:236 (+) Transcript_50833:1991-2698(+)
MSLITAVPARKEVSDVSNRPPRDLASAGATLAAPWPMQRRIFVITTSTWPLASSTTPSSCFQAFTRPSMGSASAWTAATSSRIEKMNIGHCVGGTVRHHLTTAPKADRRGLGKELLFLFQPARTLRCRYSSDSQLSPLSISATSVSWKGPACPLLQATTGAITLSCTASMAFSTTPTSTSITAGNTLLVQHARASDRDGQASRYRPTVPKAALRTITDSSVARLYNTSGDRYNTN